MANFRIEVDKTAAGNFRVRHVDPKTGGMVTDHIVDKDERLFVDGEWLTAKSIAKELGEKVKERFRLKQLGREDTSLELAPLVEKFIDEMTHLELATNTIIFYEKCLKAFFTDNPSVKTLGALYEKDLFKNWRNSMKTVSGYTVRTIVGRLVAMHRFIHWLQEEKILTQDPMPRKILPQLKKVTPRFYETAEFKVLADTMAKLSQEGLKAIYLMYCCDLRVVEVVGTRDGGRQGVRYEDIQWGPEGADLILRAEVVKGQETARVIPIPSGVVEILGSRVAGPVVKLTRSEYEYLFWKARRLANIRLKLNSHDLRRSFGKNYIQRGRGDRGSLQQLYGHSDVKTTSIYEVFEASYTRPNIERAWQIQKQEEALLSEGQMRGKPLEIKEPGITGSNDVAQTGEIKTDGKNASNG